MSFRSGYFTKELLTLQSNHTNGGVPFAGMQRGATFVFFMCQTYLLKYDNIFNNFILTIMKKFLLTLLSIIIILLILVGGALAYFGFIPALSNTFVTRVDLGIENNPQLSLDLREKTGVQFNIPEDELPTDKEVVYEGTLNIDESLTSQQVTSILNIVKAEIASMPFSNVQIRINEDGTSEASFDLDIETTITEAKKLGYSDEEIEKGKRYLGVLGDSVYIYTKISFDISDDELTVNPHAFRIQNFNVPTSITKVVADVGSNAIGDRLSQVPNLYIESLKQVGDRLNFKGTIPESLSIVD